jgi:hypothetical protein
LGKIPEKPHRNANHNDVPVFFPPWQIILQVVTDKNASASEQNNTNNGVSSCVFVIDIQLFQYKKLDHQAERPPCGKKYP